ncbi:MAG: hypothetical protein EOP53_11215 [Sphingobacteriales bacterium]|nr:MAG: hypothetical protein EOP53_11215 [Sphingobacteriales bacterium]
MKKNYLCSQICVLFSVIIFFCSCSAQTKTNSPKENISKFETKESKQPRIKKPKDASKYDNIGKGLVDHKGNLWVGVSKNGIYVYDGKLFTHFTEEDGLCSNNIFSLFEDKAGNMWVGTSSGLCRFDGEKFTKIPLGITNGLYVSRFKTTQKNMPEKNAVWSMMQDKTGKIWFGTYGDGIYCYDGKSFSHFLHNDQVINQSNLALNAANSIIEDRNGNIWFATWFEGICRYDGKALTNFTPNGEVWYSSLLEDKNGNIWTGRRSKGAVMYDGKAFQNILQNGVFDSCGVGPMMQDKAGNIWFGSEHGDMTKREILGGVWRYDGKTFKNFTLDDGLSNMATFFVLEDKTGNIWVGTRNMGLCRFDGKTFTQFTE